MLTICLLILLGMYYHRPLGTLVEKLKNVNWSECAATVWSYIVKYGKEAGRVTLRPLLLFYFVMQDENTSVIDKAIIYGCIAYVLLPYSLIPRAIFRILGVLDETAAVMMVYKRVHDKITPEMENRADDLLDSWFGADYAVIE